MTRQVVVDIVGDESRFTAATDRAAKAGGRFSKDAVKGFGLGVGLGVFDLAKDAVGAFVGQLGEMGQAYRDDQVSQAKLKNALKNSIPEWNGSTDAVEKFAGAQVKLGFQDDDLRDSIGQLVGITHDQQKAIELTSLAMDLSRSKGIDLAQATDIVTKAAQGNGKALKSLGIDTQGATDAAGLLAAIHQNTLGAALDYSTTEQGKADVAAAKNAESMERIGKIVTDVSSAVLPVAADAFANLATGIEYVAGVVGPVVAAVAQRLTPVLKAVGSFVSGTLIPVLTRVAQVVLPPLRTIVETLANVWSTEFAIIGNVIGAVVTVVTGVVSKIQGGWNTLIGFLGGLPARVSKAVGGLFDGIWNAFRSVINSIIRGWNGLKFTVPSVDAGPLGKLGGFTIGTPNIPYLHSGGVVPGPRGADVPAILQAGETVIPAGAKAGIVIQVYGDVYGDSLDELSRKIASRIRVSGG